MYHELVHKGRGSVCSFVIDHAPHGKLPTTEDSPGVVVMLVVAGDEDTEREGTESANNSSAVEIDGG